MQYVLSALTIALLSSVTSAVPLKTYSQATNWTTATYDVIIVGAGPAGIIVADRLSEAGKNTLLLEQGGKSYGIVGGTERPDWLNGTNLSRVDVPGLYKSIFSGPSDLLCGTKLDAFGACTIGGNSAINAGLFFQPPASDWDIYHPEGWKSADVENATKRLYSRQPSEVITSSNDQLYLQSGYEAARQWLVDGAGFANVTINDVADDKYKVFGHPSFDYSGGQRGGPVTTYLQSALTRSNFQLQSGVQVQRVVRSGAQATGVLATIDGQDTTINLAENGRVILSGGALFSPQILMYSGIGDPATLANLSQNGILGDLSTSDWINSTAVGAGLFDNPNTFIELEGSSLQSYTYSYNNPNPDDANLYVNARSGPYSFASETSAFWSYINHTDGTPPTGLQGTIDSSGFSASANSPDTITLNVYGTSGLLSKGRVILDQYNFAPGPSSDVYYSDPSGRDADDIATFIHDIFSYLPAAGLTPLNIPQNSTQAYIKEYITTPSDYAVGMVNHWSSSCRIGDCVDNTTKVIGTDNIHVVDASIIMPLTVNPQFGVMVAAERASELILANY